MRIRWRLLGVRAAFLAPLAAALTLLALSSSLWKLTPIPANALPFITSGVLVLALTPALIASASPLPGALAVIVPVIAAASYHESRLDWLRTLKDFGVASPGTPSPVRLGLGILALALAWALHAADTSARLQADALARGVPREQARQAGGIVRARSMRLFLIAIAGTAGITALALLAARLDLSLVFGGQAHLLVPLLAIGLLAGAAVLLWSGRGRPDEP